MSGNRLSQVQSHRGTIYYTPTSPIEKPRLPIPPFQSRERRPHSIHITRFPSGFAFYEPAHPQPNPIEPVKRTNSDYKKLISKRGAKKFITSLLSPFASKAKEETPVVVDARSISPEYASPSTPLPVSRARTLDSYSLATATVMPANRNSTVMSETFALASPGLNGMRDGNRPKSSSSPTVSIFSQHSPTKKPDMCKPVVHGGGVTGYVILTEPYIILTGFEHDGRPRQTENALAMIRGVLKLHVTKTVKIKKVYLKLAGVCETAWPEGMRQPSVL